MNSKNKLKEYRDTVRAEGEQLLAKHLDRIRKYVAFHGHYYTFAVKSAVLDPERDLLVVSFNVGRKDPLFEDYDSSKGIPLDYLTCKDPDAYLDLQRAKEKKEIEDRQKKDFDEKVKNQECAVAFEQRKLAELLKRGY